MMHPEESSKSCDMLLSHAWSFVGLDKDNISLYIVIVNISKKWQSGCQEKKRVQTSWRLEHLLSQQTATHTKQAKQAKQEKTPSSSSARSVFQDPWTSRAMRTSRAATGHSVNRSPIWATDRLHTENYTNPSSALKILKLSFSRWQTSSNMAWYAQISHSSSNSMSNTTRLYRFQRFHTRKPYNIYNYIYIYIVCVYLIPYQIYMEDATWYSETPVDSFHMPRASVSIQFLQQREPRHTTTWRFGEHGENKQNYKPKWRNMNIRYELN